MSDDAPAPIPASGKPDSHAPLAELLRPERFEDFIGQSHLRGRIERLRAGGRLPSLLFFGPPGCGKSTLAILLARQSGLRFIRVSAPEAGLANLRKLLSGVELLVLDELHRFSKAQQDFFLPLLESGELTLIATTTENPSFAVTRQLLSRLHVLRLKPLSRDDLIEVIRRGGERLGLGELPDATRDLLLAFSGGDGRTLLNLLEYVAGMTEDKRAPEVLRTLLPELVVRGDRDGDDHYEYASALIKSIRGSDPDAAVYWLACLLEGGEDPRFVSRRLILSAAEDVGLADPAALPLAVAAQQAVEFVGMPEGFLPLAETAIYLARAPKSNSAYAAYLAAKKEIRANGKRPVPLHLRNATTKLQKEWGFGKGYKYPHDYPGGWVEQDYLPEELKNARFYAEKETDATPAASRPDSQRGR